MVTPPDDGGKHFFQPSAAVPSTSYFPGQEAGRYHQWREQSGSPSSPAADEP